MTATHTAEIRWTLLADRQADRLDGTRKTALARRLSHLADGQPHGLTKFDRAVAASTKLPYSALWSLKFSHKDRAILAQNEGRWVVVMITDRTDKLFYHGTR